MTDSRLAASVIVSFDVFITEEDEVNTPDAHEPGYAHIEVLSHNVIQTILIDKRADLLQKLLDHDGIIELDPEHEFQKAIESALENALKPEAALD